MSIIGPNGEELVSPNPTPEVGQVWADNDERTKGAGEFKIVGIDLDSDRDRAWDYAIVKRGDGYETTISTHRFADTGSRGYRYIGRAK